MILNVVGQMNRLGPSNDQIFEEEMEIFEEEEIVIFGERVGQEMSFVVQKNRIAKEIDPNPHLRRKWMKHLQSFQSVDHLLIHLVQLVRQWVELSIAGRKRRKRQMRRKKQRRQTEQKKQKRRRKRQSWLRVIFENHIRDRDQTCRRDFSSRERHKVDRMWPASSILLVGVARSS